MTTSATHDATGNAPYALITGGGTGGHVYPALAVADELVRRGHDRSAVRFVGSRRGLEATSVPAAGYEIELLPGRGVRRSLQPSAVLANVGAVLGLVAAFVRRVQDRRTPPPARRVRRRRLRVGRVHRRGAAPSGPGGRARAERRARAGEPPRRATRRARRGVAARTRHSTEPCSRATPYAARSSR